MFADLLKQIAGANFEFGVAGIGSRGVFKMPNDERPDFLNLAQSDQHLCGGIRTTDHVNAFHLIAFQGLDEFGNGAPAVFYKLPEAIHPVFLVVPMSAHSINQDWYLRSEWPHDVLLGDVPVNVEIQQRLQ
jgi:hypothetical protein